MKLKIVSDGTWEGTHLYDADSGKPFAVEGGHVNCRVKAGKDGGSAEVVVTLKGVPVEVTSEVGGPFEFIGHNG